MEVKNGTHIRLLLTADVLLVIGLAEESENDAVGAQRGLNHIRNILLVLGIIEVAHIDTGDLLMLGQIIVGPISNSPELTPAKGEGILDIGSALGVEGQLLLVVIAQADVLFIHPQGEEPVTAEASPVLK